MDIAPYTKAVIAFVAPGVISLGSAITDASDGGSRITSTECVTAVVLCFATSVGVYSVENKPKGVAEFATQDQFLEDPDLADHDSDLPGDVHPKGV